MTCWPVRSHRLTRPKRRREVTNQEAAMTIEYPSADDIHAIHERIVVRSDKTEPGVRTPEAVESALTYISEGYFDEAPETIHEKAAHLMRLLVADHPYVDGNKRTALTAAVVFYARNGYYFDADDQVRDYLRQFATDAETVDMNRVATYLDTQTTQRS